MTSVMQVESDAEPESTIEPRRMLPRTLEADYFSLEGLQRLTATKPENLDRLIIKELIDNALDICDETDNLRTPTVSVNVSRINGKLMIQIDDNGSGITEEGIKKITDFRHFYSSRFHYKFATRGALGNAWKAIIGANYALSRAKHTEQVPITVSSGTSKYEIHGEYDGEASVPAPCQNEIKKRIGTSVHVALPLYGEDWGDPDRYRSNIEAFAFFNPQARITFQGGIIAESQVKRAKNKEKPRESPHWLSQNEHVQRYETQVRDWLERGEHLRLDSYIRQYYGASRDSQVKAILEKANLENCLAEQLLGKPEEIIKLHEAMKEVCACPSANILGQIGRTNLGFRIEDIDGLLDSAKGFNYKCFKDTYILREGESEIEVPYVLEVAIGVNRVGNRQIHVGLNRSIKMEDPFSRIVFFQEHNQDWVGIKGILERNGISRDQSVTCLVHIVCPAIQYKDPGKTQINTDLFDVGDTVDRASKFYKRAKKRFELLRTSDGETFIPERVKEVTFAILPEAIRHETSDGKFPKYKQRMLWYSVRKLLDDKGWSAFSPEYDYFPQILDLYQEEKGIKLDGLLLEANSILYEPRNDQATYLSTKGEAEYEIPEWKYNKIIAIEKKGSADASVANKLPDILDMAIIGMQGEPAKAVRTFLKRVEKTAKERNEHIFIGSVHDADIWGNGIYLSLSQPTGRMKNNWVTVVDLGLSITEAMKLGYKPEKMTFKKPHRIPQKILDHLSEEELFALTGLNDRKDLEKPLKCSYRIELNAFTPEAFLNWLTGKLEEKGVKLKVRPPDSIVEQETRKKTDENLERHIKDLMFQQAGGQKTVNQLKAQITSKNNLDKLDITQDLDQTLRTFPEDGWRELIAKEVRSCVEIIFNDPQTIDKVIKYVRDKLEEQKPKNCTD